VSSSAETEDFAPIAGSFAEGAEPTPWCGTGLAALDAVTGGIWRGDLWLVTGAPGQGRSSFVTQIAGYAACEHGLSTYLVSNRDSAEVVAARLHAATARIPLGHLIHDRLTPYEEDRLARSVQKFRTAPLRVASGPYARHRTIQWLRRQARERPVVAVLDDPDWETPWDLQAARQLADNGATVIVTLPRERLLNRAAERHQLSSAAGLADVVLEVRHERITTSGDLVPEKEPGQAVFTVLRNRRGPTHAICMGFFAHQARYFDLDS
jgi:replicative DNA helicase